MLLRVIFENFLSFREPVQFDMFPNHKRTIHPNHIYAKSIPVLKMAAIYGANGSGKSNLVKGLLFINDFVSKNDFFKDIDVARFIHKGGNEPDKQNIKISIEFEENDKYFIYSFELSRERILSESLLRSGIGKKENEVIFRRDLDEIIVGDTIDEKVRDAIIQLLIKNPTVSLLQLNEQFPIVQGEDIQIATQWLKHSLVVVPFNAKALELIEIMDKNPQLLDFTKYAMSKVGLGVDDFIIKEESYETWITNKSHQPFSKISSELESDKILGVNQDNRPIFIAMKDNDRTIVKEFIFKHLGLNGKIFEMDINGESEGTVRLLNLIPALYQATVLGKTIIIDEIDHSIHPLLIFELIKLFSEKKTKGQLIFTTHETCLLNQKLLLRADEVWFAEKIDGATKMYSLNDFKEHNTISIENGYINGRYGAIPYIGDIKWLQ